MGDDEALAGGSSFEGSEAIAAAEDCVQPTELPGDVHPCCFESKRELVLFGRQLCDALLEESGQIEVLVAKDEHGRGQEECGLCPLARIE
jgi:hypothetical protein